MDFSNTDWAAEEKAADRARFRQRLFGALWVVGGLAAVLWMVFG